MADLSMPQRQTYPSIRGSVSDQVGLLDLQLADELTLIMEPVAGGPGFELPATALDIEDINNVFLDENGNEVIANFDAAIDAGLSDDMDSLRGKLKIVWDTGAGLIQYAPQSGFVTIDITENVVEA